MKNTLWVFILLSLFSQITHSSTDQNAFVLTDSERSSLRYHLQNLLNEEELLIRNHRADLKDIQLQERHFSALRVFERIPFTRDLPGLETSLKGSIQHFPLKWIGLKSIRFSKEGKKIPAQIYTSDQPFRFSNDQLVEVISFDIEIQTKDHRTEPISHWIKSWVDGQLRLVTPQKGEKVIQSLGRNKWLIHAQAYRFRKLNFPKLLLKDPQSFLPVQARKNLEGFQKSEPELWDMVRKINELSSKATPFYSERGQIILNNARMSFFLSHFSS